MENLNHNIPSRNITLVLHSNLPYLIYAGNRWEDSYFSLVCY